jgi:hypothetical protein
MMGFCEHGTGPSDSIKEGNVVTRWVTKLFLDRPCTMNLAEIGRECCTHGD